MSSSQTKQERVNVLQDHYLKQQKSYQIPLFLITLGLIQIKNSIQQLLIFQTLVTIGFIALIPSVVAVAIIFTFAFPVAFVIIFLLTTFGAFNSLKFLGRRASVTDNLPKEFVAVKLAIQEGMLAKDSNSFKDSNYGPLYVRLGFHTSGTYDVKKGSGGSDGATIRLQPELSYTSNAGIKYAIERLEPVKQQFSWLSYADLYTFASAVAVETLGGPMISWRPGRQDVCVGSHDDNLPNGQESINDLRIKIFGRMGFYDQELVALFGAHTLGRAHKDRSGYYGRWTVAPNLFTNFYYIALYLIPWYPVVVEAPNGSPPSTKIQFVGPFGQQMMLPADMALLEDKKTKAQVLKYMYNEKAFFKDFSNAYSKMLELGVQFS